MIAHTRALAFARMAYFQEAHFHAIAASFSLLSARRVQHISAISTTFIQFLSRPMPAAISPMMTLGLDDARDGRSALIARAGALRRRRRKTPKRDARSRDWLLTTLLCFRQDGTYAATPRLFICCTIARFPARAADARLAMRRASRRVRLGRYRLPTRRLPRLPFEHSLPCVFLLLATFAASGTFCSHIPYSSAASAYAFSYLMQHASAKIRTI